MNEATYEERDMQPHLICLDLDQTLLNDNKEISSYTKQVLNELQQRGHQIMIAMILIVQVKCIIMN